MTNHDFHLSYHLRIGFHLKVSCPDQMMMKVLFQASMVYPTKSRRVRFRYQAKSPHIKAAKGPDRALITRKKRLTGYSTLGDNVRLMAKE